MTMDVDEIRLDGEHSKLYVSSDSFIIMFDDGRTNVFHKFDDEGYLWSFTEEALIGKRKETEND